MRERTVWMITIMLLVWSALCLVAWNATRCRAENLLAPHTLHNFVPAAQRDTEDGAASIKPDAGNPETGRLIVIGFAEDAVKGDDAKHPEVQLAAELRQRYCSSVYAAVFGTHHREAAHRQVLQWLDTDGDRVLTADEKRQARIIIYGNSRGTSETIALARELSHRNIPVLLTIQVDSIGKDDGLIPPNVANAVNFYQPGGLFHGRTQISAADPERTRILGSFRMTYSDQPITPASSSWFARLFMKSHIQVVEDDPSFWQKAAALIDSQISQAGATGEAQAGDIPEAR